ncbi:MAG: metallophosphoesterase [Sphingomonadales bacterium]|nr:metallophosphoesterase [Sphingomonadales bacterium]
MAVFRSALICLLALALAAPVAAQTPADRDAISAAGDGPYISPDARQGWLAQRVASDLSPVSERVPATGRITVNAVGDIPAFVVPLRPVGGAREADIQPLAPDTRLLVLADTHGEYDIVVEFLRRQGVIDADLNWTFGNGQMVVTGDMFDRGPHQLEILWLFYKLEAEAAAAGGHLHVLLGNHEAMVMRDDLRYLHPRYPEVARILGAERYSQLFTPETLLGDWLRSKLAVLKLGDMLFTHGGISPQVVDAGLSVSDINTGLIRALHMPVARRRELDEVTGLIAGSLGPTWFRGYFADSATVERPYMPISEVQRSLEFYGVSRILVGHTIMPQVTPLYDGKVIAVQVYPRRDARTGQPILEGALRDQGRWFRVNAQGERRLLVLQED